MIDKSFLDLLDERFDSRGQRIDDATNEILRELSCNEIDKISSNNLKMHRQIRWTVILIGITSLLSLATIVITLLTD